MAIGQAVVGEPFFAEGATPQVIREGRQGDLIVSQLHGSSFENNRHGNLKIWSSGAAGVTILKYDNVTPAFVLWNMSTNYNLELVEFTVCWAGTPAVAGNVGFGIIPIAGFVIGVPISAFTALATVFNGATLRAENPPYGKCATAVTIVALAAAAYLPIFSFPDALAAASTTVPAFDLHRKFDGTLIVPPGAALVLCGNVAQTAVMGVTISWIDNIPV